MAPTLNSSDANNLDMPMRSHKVCVCVRKSVVHAGVNTVCGFRHPLGLLDISPVDTVQYMHFSLSTLEHGRYFYLCSYFISVSNVL